MTEIEYRTATGGVTGDKDTLHGLVTPFDVWTTIGDVQRGGFKERIAPGAFAKTLQERDTVLIHNHNTDLPLARTSVESGPGSLTLREDPTSGLKAVAKPVQTTTGKDVLLLAEAGVIRGMSFGFNVIKDNWTDDEGRASDAQHGTQRTVHEVRLHEVTTTAFPAYESTQLTARDSVNAARGITDTRAAAASYDDIQTCGECGSTDQYGSFCTDCGQSMSAPESDDSGPAFCGSCGSERSHKLDGETRDTEPAKTTPEVDLETHSRNIETMRRFRTEDI